MTRDHQYVMAHSKPFQSCTIKRNLLYETDGAVSKSVTWRVCLAKTRLYDVP